MKCADILAVSSVGVHDVHMLHLNRVSVSCTMGMVTSEPSSEWL